LDEEEVMMREPNRILTAEDLMVTSLLTFRPEQTILEAIGLLLKYSVSGAPVVDEESVLIGILSELDCLRMLASDEFYLAPEEESTLVGDCMSRGGRTIPPDLGIYAISHYFLTTPIRRLPVVLDGKLIGQVCRRDALRGMEEMSRKRLVRKRYPDYVQPAANSGPRRARI
jgi:CBS domain-containing protein